MSGDRRLEIGDWGRLLGLSVLLALAGCRAETAPGQTARAAAPQGDFAALVAELSEPGGYFDTDNLISNETSYLHALDGLRAHDVRGGAYIGVGPDQNFSYIAAIEPDVAFIIDIRRDNLLQQLWLKALFEVADDRAEYLALMFARPTPVTPTADGRAGLEALLEHVARSDASGARADSIALVMDSAIATFGVPLSGDDLATIRRIHAAFIDAGPALRFTTHGRAPQPYYPTYRQLLLETDRAGGAGSYLADEARFRMVKRLQEDDRIVPVVGDLAGDHALRAIGEWARGAGLEVSALYVSNVEFYLMQDGRLGAYAGNMASLPRAENGVIIRSYFHRGRGHPEAVPGYASTQLVQRIADFDGASTSYYELIHR